MKTFKKLATKTLCEFDMFAVEPTLRHKQQPFSSTSGLGFISLLLYGFFIWLFVKNLMEVVNMNSNQIKTSQTLQKNFSNRSLNNLMFGVQIPPEFILPEANRTAQISSYNLTEMLTYFTIDIAIIPYGSKSYKDYQYQKLKICDPEDWKLLGSEYQKYFKENQLFNSLCPVSPLNFSVIAIESNFLMVNIYPCVVDPSAGVTNCKNKSQIQAYKQQVIIKYGHFPLWIDYLVSVPQVGQANPIKYVVDTKRFAASTTMAQIAVFGLDSFQINTDNSIWPIIESIQSVRGVHTSQTYHAYNSINETAFYKSYMTIYTYLRPSIFVYDRTITKIDSVISYVGGLLGIILVFLGFFFESYNQYRYELKVGESSFNYYSNGQLIKQKNLNPWIYIKYSIWDWIALLADHQMKWDGCIEMDETRQEAIFMMDVQKLFRRLQFLERAIIRESDQNMLHCLTLVQPGSIVDIRRKRKMLQYYQEIIRLEQSPCVQDVIDAAQQTKKNPSKLLQFVLHSNVRSAKLNIDNNQSQAHTNKGDDEIDRGNGSNKNQDKYTNSNQQEESQQQISQSLMYDLGLQHEVDICRTIATYSGIAYQAKQMKIDADFYDIEKQMTQSFLALTPQRKSQVILNMPLKILHRLRYKAKQLKMQNIDKKEAQREAIGIKQLFMGLNQINSDNRK